MPNDELARSLTVPEMEEAVIASLITAPEFIPVVKAFLTPAMFANEVNAEVYRAALALGEATDLLTVIDWIRRLPTAGRLEHASSGLESYLAGCVTGIHSPLNAANYAANVYEAWRRRETMREMTKAAQAIYNGATAADVAATLTRSLADGLERPGDEAPLSDIIAAYDAEREHERASTSPTGIMTGISDLDRLTDGWRPGRFIVVAGRPGDGKSTLMMNAAAWSAKKGKRTAVFSLEMGAVELMRRLVAAESGVETSHMKARTQTPQQMEAEMAAQNTISRWPLHLPTGLGYTVDDIAGKIQRLNARGNPVGLVIIDYLQLMNSGSRTSNRVEEVSVITRGLKALAMTLRVPVIAGSQLNRAVADGEPQLSHLRESGSIEQDADLVMMLHNPKTPGQPNLRELYIRKNRDGATGKVPLIAQFHLSRFAGAAIDRIEL